MDQEHMTKKEKQEAKRREKLASSMNGESASPAKWIITVGGLAIFFAFFAFIVFSIKQSKNKPVTLSSQGYVRGNPNAKVELVEYGDLQCPACRAYEPMVRQLSKDYNGKLKLLYKNFPLISVHKNAHFAAQAAVAAGNQGKFWEMHDWLYDNQDSWGELAAADAQSKILAEAKNLKLDMDQFQKDLNSSSTSDKIDFTMNEGIDAGVAATPTFYIDNKKVDPLPSNYSEFKKLVGNEISKVYGK